jgi:sensor histidine kinase YesM
VEEEVALTERFIRILETRFGEDIAINLNIKSEVLKKHFPAIILQPLLENAVRHGYGPANKKLSIWIEIKSNRERIDIKMVNDGRPVIDDFDRIPLNGIGISNIDDRLRTIYKGDYSFNIKNEDGKVVVHISIPEHPEIMNESPLFIR